MQKVSEWVLRRRKIILMIALLLCVISFFTMKQVKINYNMADYLPAESPSTMALDFMGAGLPNLQVYLPEITPQEAIAQKEQLRKLTGVEGVLWLDDVADLRARPIETLPAEQVAAYYAAGGARFQLTISPALYAESFEAIHAQYPQAIFKGEAVNQARLQTVSMGEVASIMIYLVPLVLLILLLSTNHWIEPILFLLVIGVAILLNEGTNIIFGSISYVTQACSAVLQLAVSIDYAVFLLHRFAEYRTEGMDAPSAMKLAMQKSASSIAASAMTTVFGFLALLVMSFGMGPDMGLVLAKGVLLSYLSVVVLLPAAAMSVSKWIDRTAHRSLLPSFKRFGRAVVRYGAPLAILMILLLPVSYMGQERNDFTYGSAGMHAGDSPVRLEARQMDELFGKGQTMMLLVPSGDRAKAETLTQELQALDKVTAVISYATAVGTQIPPQVLPPQALAQLQDRGYDRIIVDAAVSDEGPNSFRLVEEMRAVTQQLYGDDYYLLGENVVNYDLKDSITSDNLKVLLAGLLAIGGVLLLTFRNFTIPLILLLVIEGSIWLNMAIPYFLSIPMNYIGYQIVSSVQLGATVDYGILLAQRYLEGRKVMPPREAAAWALKKATGSILPPMMILVIAGYALFLTVRSNGVISQMGEVIGRGAAISGLMVMLVLPKILHWLDSLIIRTSFKKEEVMRT